MVGGDRKIIATLSLSLLGPFEAVLDSEAFPHAPVSFRAQKELALLAYLAAEAGRWQPRADLAEMLWPERPQGVACNSFRQALFQIRRAFRATCPNAHGFLQATRQDIRISPE